jgi:NodT family efflux transporter outer membrane factor (OMF) lipoprotein
MNKLLILIIVLTLAGCKVGPDYKKPELRLSDSWFSTKKNNIVIDEKAVINQEWWKNFDDEDLTKLINLAFEQNLDVKIAASRIDGSRSEMDKAGSGFAPKINAESSLSKGNTLPGFAFKTGANKYSAYDFTASWEIDFFGHQRRLFESAKALYGSKEFAKNATLVSVASEVARNYITLRKLQNQLEILQNNIDLLGQKNSLQEKKNKYGVISDAELAKSYSNLQLEKAKLPALRNSINQTIRAIELLVGREPGYLDEMLSVSKPVPHSSADVVIAAPAEVIRNRPDVNIAEQELISANAMEGAAVANLYPRVSLTALFGYQSYELESSGGSGKLQLIRSTGLSAALPIFDFGKLKAEVKSAKSTNKEYLLRYEKTILTALNEVENNLSAYSEEINRQSAINLAVENNQKFYQSVEKSYKKDSADLEEKINAQISLNEVQSMLVDSNSESAIDLILLYKSLGGGWKRD